MSDRLAVCGMAITMVLLLTATALADDPAQGCLERATSYFAKNPGPFTGKKLMYAVLPSEGVAVIASPGEVVYTCTVIEGSTHAFYGTRTAEGWKLDTLGQFFCARFDAKNGRVRLHHEDTCQTRWFYQPACKFYHSEIRKGKKGRVWVQRLSTKIDPVCRLCSANVDCFPVARRRARKLYQAKRPKQAFNLLYGVLEFNMESIVNAPDHTQLDPWVLSDLLLYAVRARQPCGDLYHDFAYAVRLDTKAARALAYNRKLCSSIRKTGR